jgi:hypothetical protein
MSHLVSSSSSLFQRMQPTGKQARGVYNYSFSRQMRVCQLPIRDLMAGGLQCTVRCTCINRAHCLSFVAREHNQKKGEKENLWRLVREPVTVMEAIKSHALKRSVGVLWIDWGSRWDEVLKLVSGLVRVNAPPDLYLETISFRCFMTTANELDR